MIVVVSTASDDLKREAEREREESKETNET